MAIMSFRDSVVIAELFNRYPADNTQRRTLKFRQWNIMRQLQLIVLKWKHKLVFMVELLTWAAFSPNTHPQIQLLK